MPQERGRDGVKHRRKEYRIKKFANFITMNYLFSKYPIRNIACRLKIFITFTLSEFSDFVSLSDA